MPPKLSRTTSIYPNLEQTFPVVQRTDDETINKPPPRSFSQVVKTNLPQTESSDTQISESTQEGEEEEDEEKWENTIETSEDKAEYRNHKLDSRKRHWIGQFMLEARKENETAAKEGSIANIYKAIELSLIHI